MRWQLRCLLCQVTPKDLPFSPHNDLVRLQEHAMQEHGAEQEDFRRQMRHTISEKHYVWTLIDGREWLEAKGGDDEKESTEGKETQQKDKR